MGFNRMQAIGQLNRILTYGRISPWLRKAVAETIKAIRAGNYKLAADLTSVKSIVASRAGMRLADFRGKVFAEDETFNEQVLGESVYGILDGMHHDIALTTHQIPSGMVDYGFTSAPAAQAFGMALSQVFTGRLSQTPVARIDPMKDKIIMRERGESFRKNIVVRKIEEEKEKIRREVYGRNDNLMRGH